MSWKVTHRSRMWCKTINLVRKEILIIIRGLFCKFFVMKKIWDLKYVLLSFKIIPFTCSFFATTYRNRQNNLLLGSHPKCRWNLAIVALVSRNFLPRKFVINSEIEIVGVWMRDQIRVKNLFFSRLYINLRCYGVIKFHTKQILGDYYTTRLGEGKTMVFTILQSSRGITATGSLYLQKTRHIFVCIFTTNVFCWFLVIFKHPNCCFVLQS